MRAIRSSLAILLGATVLCVLQAPARASSQIATDPWPGQLPLVWHLEPPQPCEGVPVELVFQALICNPCMQIVEAGMGDSGGVRVRSRILINARCQTDSCPRDQASVSLGLLAAGFHHVQIELIFELVAGDSVYEVVRHEVPFDFEVLPQCGPPPGGPLPFVERIEIFAAPREDCMGVRRVCPEDSIHVRFVGSFPSDCYKFLRTEVFFMRMDGLDPAGSPLPRSPIVRAVVAKLDGRCRIPCTDGPFPWSAEVVLPPMPGGDYVLPAQLGLVLACPGVPDSAEVDSVWTTLVPFAVLDSCRTADCMLAGWLHPNDGPCDAFVSPDHPAQVTLGLRSPVPLAGLQGEFSLFPEGLRIADIRPALDADGLHLQWAHTEHGASFVMFAERGAPIGGNELCAPPVPVVHVELVQPEGVVAPEVTHVVVGRLLGSDSLGHGVPHCPVMTLVLESARVCARRLCDFNHDGGLDVRDLVLMVRCIQHTGPCPDTARVDCNGDGAISLDDVICCARHLLRGPRRDSLGTRPEPGVALRFGTPEPVPGGLAVPMRLTGSDRIGAALLGLDYPRDRFDLEGVDLMNQTQDWLCLQEPAGDGARVGLLWVGGPRDGSTGETLELKLRLKLKPGAEPGGMIRATEGDFAGEDGVSLEVQLGEPAQALGPERGVALSAAQPNPFSGAMRFSVTLASAQRVDVGLYDMNGRRLLTLHRGMLPAGTKELGWDGRLRDGSEAPSGVYFYRLTAPGLELARRVVFLRGR